MGDKKPATRQLPLPMRVYDGSFFISYAGAIKQGLVRDVGPLPFCVLVVLKAHARPTDGRIYMSLGDLASITGMSVSTIRRALRTLEEAQLIQVVQSGETSRRRYFIVDRFRWKQLGEGSTTDAREALESGQHDGESSVLYVGRTATSDQHQLQAWMTANEVPLSPNVQVIAQKVERQFVQTQQVATQVVQHQHNHFHGITPESVEALTEAVAEKLELQAPFLRTSPVLKRKGVTE